MCTLKPKLIKICALLKKNGLLYTINFLFGRLIIKCNKHLVYEAHLDGKLCTSRWTEDEKLFNFGPEDLQFVREDKNLMASIGGESAKEYLESVSNGDRMFVVQNKKGYVYHHFILFSSRHNRILGEEENVPYLSNVFTVPSERGHGIYRRALIDSLVYLQRAGYNRVIADVHPDNHASRKGIEAASFRLRRAMTTCTIFYKICIRVIRTDSRYNIEIGIV